MKHYIIMMYTMGYLITRIGTFYSKKVIVGERDRSTNTISIA